MPASAIRSTTRRVYRITLALAAMLSVAIVVLASALFFVLQNLDRYRDDIAARVAQALGQPVTIGAASVHWSRATPILRIEGLRLPGNGDGRGVGFRSAELHIDPLHSLRLRTLSLSAIRVMGARLEVARDVDGRFELSGLGAAGGLDPDVLRALLRAPGRVTLSAAELVYRDLASGAQPVALDVDATLERGAAGARKLTGAIRLPGRSQSYVVLDGQLTLPEPGTEWQLDVGVQSAGVLAHDLRALLPALRLPGQGLMLRFDLRLRAGGGQHLSVDGPLALAGLDWLPDEQVRAGPRRIEARIGLRLRERGWRAQASGIHVQGLHGPWQAPRASLEYLPGTTLGSGRYSATLSDGRLEDLLAVLAFLEPQDRDVQALRALQARGDTHDLWLGWVDGPQRPTPFNLGADLRGVTWPESDAYWGVSGLSGQLSLTQRGGVLRLDPQAGLGLSAAPLFSGELAFTHARGALQVGIAPGRLHFASEALDLQAPDLAVRVAGELWSDAEPAPRVDLAVELQTAPIRALTAHLPSPALGPAVSDWLRDALPGGRVEQARLRLRGRTDALLTQRDPGAMQLDMRFADLTLAYGRGWPSVTGLAGQLGIEDGRLQASAASAGNPEAGQLAVDLALDIEALGSSEPRLTLRTDLRGDAALFLRQWRQLPGAAPPGGGPLETLAASGPLQARTVLVHELATERQTVRTELMLDGNRLELPDSAVPPLEAVRGSLRLDADGVSADGLELLLDGRPARLDVRLDADASGNVVLRQRASVGDWWRLAGQPAPAPAWLAALPGEADWQASLTLDRASATEVALESDLRGITVALPAPLGKSAETPRSMRLATMPGADTPLRLDMDTLVQALVLRDTAGTPQGGAVRLGEGPLPAAQAGQWRVRGVLPTLDLADLRRSVHEAGWVDAAWFAPGRAPDGVAPDGAAPDGTAPDGAPPDAGAPAAAQGRAGATSTALDAQLAIEALRIGGVDFGAVELRYPYEGPDGLGLRGAALSGRVQLPGDDGAIIDIDLERLVLPQLRADTADAGDAPGDGGLDPTGFPPLSVTVKALSYAGRELGTLKFLTRPIDQGVAFDKLYLIGEGLDTQGQARWTLSDGQHHTHLQAAVHADQLAALLRAVGQGQASTEGGATQIDVLADWAGSPASATLASMTGEIEFQAGPGRFLDIGPGTGARLFGLLNLQSLPRLLSLDFRSLFEQGFEYQGIHGRFAVEGGHAYTSNLRVEAATARISVAGRTGLITEDYDQTVSVRPKLTDSLPMAGAAFGGVGAGVGAALWLVERVLQTDIVDRVATYGYRVTGSWDDPDVQRIEPEVDPNSAGK